MVIGVFGGEAKVGLFIFSFPVVQYAPYSFHIDDSVYLAGGEFAQPIFAAGSDDFLVHSHFGPIFGHIFFFGSVEE